MSRILFLAPRFHTNQSELVAGLLDRGHDVSYVVMGQSKSEDHSRLTPTVMPPSRLNRIVSPFIAKEGDGLFYRARRTVPSLRAMYREIFGFKPDVAIIRPFYSYFVFIALCLFRLRGTRVVLYTQTPKYKRSLRWRDRRNLFVITQLLRWRLFTVVERIEGEAEYVDLSPKKHFIPFAHSVNEDAIGRSYNLIRPRILVIGKFVGRKNYDALLEALALVKYPYTLTIIGENTTQAHSVECERILLKMKALNLESNITVYQNQEHEFVCKQYLEHDIFLLPSYAEPASVSQLEAMAAGLPVVICRDNGTANYVEHQRNGLLCDRSAESIAESLNYLLVEPRRIETFGKESLSVLREKCSPSTVCERLEGLLLN